MVAKTKYVRWFEDVDSKGVAEVGGKNASLGEMIRNLKDKGIKVPDGFATTASAYQAFLDKKDGLREKVKSLLDELENNRKPVHEVGGAIRELLMDAEFPDEVAEAIRDSYRELCQQYEADNVAVAVRSSATAEDLPEASFAGQQESFLNISGERRLVDACKQCYASLFTDRAISYRIEKGFNHMKVALSVGVQKMVRSDMASAGVMFSLDPETGFRDVVVINASWGLGESVVHGLVNPDEFIVFKPLIGKAGLVPIICRTMGEKEKKIIYSKGGTKTTKSVDTSRKERRSFTLSDDEVLTLAHWTCDIEQHYGKPMDIEWAKDGESGELFIVQARPETVQSQKETASLKTYRLKERGERLLSGLSIGQAIAAGKAQVIKNADETGRFKDGSVLITGMTDPDWVPIMKRASGIITDLGGRTSHAAIVSRELGIAAVVGTGEATETLKDGQEVTISCAEGDEGYVYDGILDFDVSDVSLEKIPETQTKIMMNISSPAAAFRWWRLPVSGIGLARMEFIINNIIQIHPMALVHFADLEGKEVRQQIARLTRRYDDKSEYFVDCLAQGIARIAASQYPKPVIVRMSDFKTNEYANLIGGKQFEPDEENPMLGLRGASRYYSDRYRDGFALECRAIKQVRNVMGLNNVIVMIPFCRTPAEAEKVLDVLAQNGLERRKNGLQVYLMAEIPSNVILAEDFCKYFDGFSIGSNDLTQLVLGVDRDSAELAYLFDEQHKAVKNSIAELIASAHKKNRKVGLCGQAPSDYPEFAAFLVKAGIDSVSVNPDSALPVIQVVAKAEQKRTE
ncbi:MAG: phosphoenolpyruvate synthase [Chloroflexota bacterium]|nr:phosphoenolpyruvate synthase [Chloroflexota bacterium]